jgi:hypothetical protein
MADFNPPYPTWLHTRLSNMFNNPPRYENSYYGPLNSILNCIFPPGRSFMVKPQAILRPAQPTVSSPHLPPGSTPHPLASRSSSRIPDAAAGAATNAAASSHNKQASISSLDSLGDKTLSRSEGGWEEALFKPDFLVVKASAQMTNDIALALVEAKLHDVNVEIQFCRLTNILKHFKRRITLTISLRFYVWDLVHLCGQRLDRAIIVRRLCSQSLLRLVTCHFAIFCSLFRCSIGEGIVFVLESLS